MRNRSQDSGLPHQVLDAALGFAIHETYYDRVEPESFWEV